MESSRSNQTESARRAPTVQADEVELTAVRSQGAGGQNVNKVASAIHLRFNIHASSLPFWLKTILLTRKDRRITVDGMIIIKSQQYRTQERNRMAALERLQDMIDVAAKPVKARIATRPSRSAKRKRLESKSKRSIVKNQRRRVDGD